jgi:hypothetical protein
MRIARARVTLPARMKNTAAGDARSIAEAVAEAIAAHPVRVANVSISLAGNGRPARQLASDLFTAAGSAVRPSRRGDV